MESESDLSSDEEPTRQAIEENRFVTGGAGLMKFLVIRRREFQSILLKGKDNINHTFTGHFSLETNLEGL